MILFVGQVAVGDKGREAFQEVDYKAPFSRLWQNGQLKLIMLTAFLK